MMEYVRDREMTMPAIIHIGKGSQILGQRS